jgi:hypothetical protein
MAQSGKKLKLHLISTALTLALGCLPTGKGALSQRNVHQSDGGDKPVTVRMQLANPNAKVEYNHTTRTKLDAHPVKTTEFARHGKVRVNNTEVDVYLAANASYTRINASRDAWANTSTLLCVDQNRDGWISLDECRNISLPLRIGDRMFTVPYIASDGSEITLLPSREPLDSLVVGHPCPAFAYRTLAGKAISLRSLKGRTFLIDLWSFT